tara:strand:- start:46 stop:468 length:423 start_codon:yes stop_codon:yes gene_type:complete
MDKIKLAQRTIALLSSMIESGECHTTRSREMKNNALNGLEQLTIPVVSERSCCSKCGKSLSTRWEESACHIKLEIGIDCCSTEALFGRDENIGFNHPAIKEGSGYQKVFIESRKESDYRLCWNCHRDFVKQVGTFLKNDC